MNFPDLHYIEWAKALPRARINLARSGVEPCPPAMLRPRREDVVTTLPVRYGWEPLLDAIARRYRVGIERVYTVSGGTSFANWIACAAILDGCGASAEVIVERPTYEPLLRIPQAMSHRVRRLERRFEEDYRIDIDRFARLVSRRTRLAIVTNLHNPSGARIGLSTLREMARILDRVGGVLLVDEVYLECEFGRRPASCVHAGGNVVVTNSLTKAYGLDGLRAGWILGPVEIVRRAGVINNLMANNGVAPGEWLARKAFTKLAAIRRRAHSSLDSNLRSLRAFFETERRLEAVVPAGGNVAFPRVPPQLDGDALADHLLDRYSTLVVPGRFFEAPQHIRISFGVRPALFSRGLRNLSQALNDFGA